MKTTKKASKKHEVSLNYGILMFYMYQKWDLNPHEHYCSTDFLTTLCYHSQTKNLSLYSRSHFFVCCGLDCLFTILLIVLLNNLGICRSVSTRL